MVKPPELTSLQWIAAKLRRLRQERGLRLQDVADRMGTAHSRISDTESGRYDIKTTTLLRFLDALGTTPNDFFADMPRLKEAGEGTREATRDRSTATIEKAKELARDRNKRRK